MTCELRIGASGWHYKHWLGPFYPADLPASKMLAFYTARFDTVEINNSFYKLPSAETFEKWRQATPPGFSFAVKASRFITHMKKLKEPRHALENFLPRAEVLAEKLGTILFQLPPHWHCNTERLAEFLETLPAYHRYTFELRDPSWHNSEVYSLLSQHNAAFCIYQLSGFESPVEITADFTYIRLHGPTESAYQGSYDSSSLQFLAGRIRDWQRRLKAIYVYFDNDQAGFAAHNALELKRLLSS